MTEDNRNDAMWRVQREAQRQMSIEDRLRQNDAMTRLRHEAERARQRARA